MSIDEFRNALRSLLNDAIRAGLTFDQVKDAAVDEVTCGGTFEADDEQDANK